MLASMQTTYQVIPMFGANIPITNLKLGLACNIHELKITESYKELLEFWAAKRFLFPEDYHVFVQGKPFAFITSN